ncbi:MAG: helix-turn-helix transcriptional regulator [Rhodospirillaceae bacterium]|nr:helix-turn-helix transcriptional regulator [Rhodospirillaceae bacterium]MDE0619066.1 helix-turn-helix transcriptional regulator [Rhodospirillaceae bacterium]
MSSRTAFDRILASLHNAVLDDTHWPTCSALIDEACRTKGNILTFARGQSPDDVEIYLAPLYYRGERHHTVERAYFDHYYPQDERIPRLMRLPDSDVVHITSLYTEEELKTSAAFNENLPIGQFQNSVNVRMDGPNGTRITWCTADPVDGEGWSFTQTAFIRELLPHLRQYVIVRQALGAARALGTSLTELLDKSRFGIVHLDGRGRIVTANGRARDILRTGDALFDRDGFLRARFSADNAGLQATLARALPGWGAQGESGSLAIRRPNHLPGLTVHINPVGDGEIDFRPWRVAALVLVIDREPKGIDPDFVGAVLGLTPAESCVAVLLAEGKTVRDIAAATGRSEKTVRWHVQQIFEKRGISRQTDLVRQVLSLDGTSASGS